MSTLHRHANLKHSSRAPSAHPHSTALPTSAASSQNALLLQQAQTDPASLSAAHVLSLQQAIGNRAVQSILATPHPPIIQRKPDDESLALSGLTLTQFRQYVTERQVRSRELAAQKKQQIQTAATGHKDSLNGMIEGRITILQDTIDGTIGRVSRSTGEAATSILAHRDAQIEAVHQAAQAELKQLPLVVQGKQKAIRQAAQIEGQAAMAVSDTEGLRAILECRKKAKYARDVGEWRANYYQDYHRASKIAKMAIQSADDVAKNIEQSGNDMLAGIRNEATSLSQKFDQEAQEAVNKFGETTPKGQESIRAKESETVDGLRKIAAESLRQLNENRKNALDGSEGLRVQRQQIAPRLRQVLVSLHAQIDDIANRSTTEIDRLTDQVNTQVDQVTGEVSARLARTPNKPDPDLLETWQALSNLFNRHQSGTTQFADAVEDIFGRIINRVQTDLDPQLDQVAAQTRQQGRSFETRTAEAGEQARDKLSEAANAGIADIHQTTLNTEQELDKIITQSQAQWHKEVLDFETKTRDKIQQALAGHDQAIRQLINDINKRAVEISNASMFSMSSLWEFIKGIVSGFVGGLIKLFEGLWNLAKLAWEYYVITLYVIAGLAALIAIILALKVGAVVLAILAIVGIIVTVVIVLYNLYRMFFDQTLTEYERGQLFGESLFEVGFAIVLGTIKDVRGIVQTIRTGKLWTRSAKGAAELAQTTSKAGGEVGEQAVKVGGEVGEQTTKAVEKAPLKTIPKIEPHPPIAKAQPPVKLEPQPPVKIEAQPPVKLEAQPPVKIEPQPPVKLEPQPPVKLEPQPPAPFRETLLNHLEPGSDEAALRLIYEQSGLNFPKLLNDPLYFAQNKERILKIQETVKKLRQATSESERVATIRELYEQADIDYDRLALDKAYMNQMHQKARNLEEAIDRIQDTAPTIKPTQSTEVRPTGGSTQTPQTTRFKQAMSVGTDAEREAAALELVQEAGDLKSLRKLVDSGQLGDVRTARAWLQKGRQKIIQKAQNQITQEVGQKYGVTFEYSAPGTPGFTSDIDVTVIAKCAKRTSLENLAKRGSMSAQEIAQELNRLKIPPGPARTDLEMLLKNGQLRPENIGKYLDRADLANEVSASVEASQRFYAQDLLGDADKTLDANFYTKLREEEFAALATTAEKTQALEQQSLVSMVEMQQNMSETAWQAYKAKQIQTLGQNPAAQERLLKQFQEAEDLFKKWQDSPLSTAKEELVKLLQDKNASYTQIREAMAKIKMKEPDSYGTHAAFQEVVSHLQTGARRSDDMFVQIEKSLRDAGIDTQRLTDPRYVRQVQSKLDQVEQALRQGHLEDVLETIELGRGHGWTKGSLEHLMFMTQNASANMGKLYHINPVKDPAAPAKVSKYLQRILFASRESGVPVSEATVNLRELVEMVKAKAAADSARAMGEVLQKWARRVGKLDIINDQTKLREAWIDTIRDLAQDTVVRMRAKEMTMARPGAVMPK